MILGEFEETVEIVPDQEPVPKAEIDQQEPALAHTRRGRRGATMGILSEPVVGWRHYGVSIPGLLTSNDCVVIPRERAESFCKGRFEWKPTNGDRDYRQVKVAEPCQNGPQVGCTCGFYAFNSVEAFFKDGTYVTKGVFAQVAMWGTVQVYRRGYRAQFAYPMGMWAYGELAESVRLRLQLEYRVPVRLFEDDFAMEIGAHNQRMASRRDADRPATEDELWDRVSMGDDAATKTLRARLSSAICTRRKAVTRLEKEIARNKLELTIKLAQREGLKRSK